MGAGSKPPPFFCPKCGQKHRADLAPLAAHPGAVLRTHCRRCAATLSLTLDGGTPVCAVVEGADPASGGPYETDGDLRPGDRAGRYRIEAPLRRGETATVYRAHDPETKRTVALKVLRAEATEEVRRRFLRQVEVQGAIRHPNVVPVYDRGALADDRPFFAAELLHAPRTLDEIVALTHTEGLEDAPGLSVLSSIGGLVEHVLLPIAEGVYVANVENGQIHGDLRPQNVLIDGRTGRPYLADFGYAAAPSEAPTREDRAHARHVTPYVAPESVAGDVNPRTDVWGLGALLHLVLVGKPPLDGKGRSLIEAARSGTVRPLPAGVDPALAAIARKALSKDPEARYVNARQMAADLRAWRQGGWVRAVDAFGDEGAQRHETRAAIKRGGRLALWVLGGLVVGIAVGSQIRARGGDAGSPRIAAAAEDVEQLDKEVGALVGRASRLEAEEAAHIWADVVRRADLLQSALSEMPPSEPRQAVEDRLRYVLGRLQSPRVRTHLPEGVALEARHETLLDTRRIAGGDAPTSLPPGRYVVQLDGSDAFLFPLSIPLDVRGPGVEEEDPVLELEIPGAARTPPAGTAFVLGGRVRPLLAPWAATSRPVRVASFFLERQKVTKDAWALFLAGLPAEDRSTRVPADGFLWEEASRTARVVPGRGREAVMGVSTRDAQAYCAWLSAKEDSEVRLPTEAEWVLAAGGGLVDPPRGALDLPRPRAPYAIERMTREPRELAATADGGFVLKGPIEASATRGAAIYTREMVDAAARRADACFRCVWEIP